MSTAPGTHPGRPEDKKQTRSQGDCGPFSCKKRHGAILDDWGSAHFINFELLAVADLKHSDPPFFFERQ